MDRNEMQKIIEGILFTMGDSVDPEKIAAALETEQEEVISVLDELALKYENEDRGIRITKLEGAYQMCTSPDIYEYLIRIAKQPKKYFLTDTLLETLSIIAYKQPVTKTEIEKIRGVSCEHAVNKLLEYDLIKEFGRLDAPGKPILFGTTENFLRCFGVTSISDLPQITPDQVEEYKKEAEAEISVKLDI